MFEQSKIQSGRFVCRFVNLFSGKKANHSILVVGLHGLGHSLSSDIDRIIASAIFAARFRIAFALLSCIKDFPRTK
jgi:hypothetical protein